MKRPVIGLVAAYLPCSESKSAFHCGRLFANETYSLSVSKAGGNPILILPSDDLASSLSLVDGLLFMGGHDIDPSFYFEEKLELCGKTFIEEDRFQLDVFNLAIKQQKPILGICRGHQLANIALGGSLYQDICLRDENIKEHDLREQYDTASQEIIVKEGSTLFSLLGRSRVAVNSLHHQSVKRPGKGLEVTAWTEDGSIEATEGENILTVQFHPESMVMRSDELLPIFTWLIDRARK